LYEKHLCYEPDNLASLEGFNHKLLKSRSTLEYEANPVQIDQLEMVTAELNQNRYFG
jgi:hypothetical protein